MTGADNLDDATLAEFFRTLYNLTGYDFRDYSANSMRRRVQRILHATDTKSLSDLQRRVVEDSRFQSEFIQSLSIPTTAMFRDPEVFKFLRGEVLPRMAEQADTFRVWVMGCSTGEEAYSVAIMLLEEGLLKRAVIYATDMNSSALAKAKSAVLPSRLMQDYTKNYLHAGGTADFSSYYTCGYNLVLMRDDLKERIVFAQHNLVTDSSINEFNLVFCRNVLIYFNAALQGRVHQLINQSLVVGGFLVLGEKEALRSSTVSGDYQMVDRSYRIFQKIK